MEYKPMTLKERLAIAVRSIELEDAGQPEEADKVWKQMPLDPFWAKYAKEHYGPDFLIKGGYNLAEAEAEYGKDWLTQ
jgi:hypothetical protein